MNDEKLTALQAELQQLRQSHDALAERVKHLEDLRILAAEMREEHFQH